jgi:hypothetical protein
MADMFGYAICLGIFVGLFALARVYFRALKDPNEPGAAAFVGSIAGFIVSILIWLGQAYLSENGGSSFSFSAVLGICVGGGAVAGGLGASVWGQKHDILSITPVGQGIVGGSIGAVIGLVILFVFLLLMMGG